jgi:RHS repeat-associated protein
MTTTTGVTATERFDDWGNKLTGSGAIPIYGYTGREQDGTPTTGTGFIYYRARYYDPANARFTQSDPIELKGGINAYTYVKGNSVNWVDPTGLTPDGSGGDCQTIKIDAGPPLNCPCTCQKINGFYTFTTCNPFINVSPPYCWCPDTTGVRG